MKFQDFSNAEMKAERVASCAQMSGESSEKNAPASPLACEALLEALHDLNNAFAVVLMNAQVLECKLPSYSRSKRYIHEIERGAQRGGALLKRLMANLSAGSVSQSLPAPIGMKDRIPPVAEAVAVVATQELRAFSGEEVLPVAPSRQSRAAPVFVSD